MNTLAPESTGDIAAHGARALARGVWHLVRLPLLALLIVLEPIVSAILVFCAMVGTITALVFRLATTLPDFPFWGMLGVSLGCAGALALYHGLMRVLTNP